MRLRLWPVYADMRQMGPYPSTLEIETNQNNPIIKSFPLFRNKNTSNWANSVGAIHCLLLHQPNNQFIIVTPPLISNSINEKSIYIYCSVFSVFQCSSTPGQPVSHFYPPTIIEFIWKKEVVYRLTELRMMFLFICRYVIVLNWAMKGRFRWNPE